ncbi:MAG: riboflavin synthase [bacterium]|nr:MAG: riboflavin synthase [bacterium]
MFTGIIEEIGKIAGMERRRGGARLDVEASLVLEGTRPGDSIAVNGVCLTAERVGRRGFSAFLSVETLERTTFASSRPGDPVNLERSLALGDRLGGHLVSGHVEATGTVKELVRSGESHTLMVSYPETFSQYVVPKGSVSVDGVSLTIVARMGDLFTVSVVPKTFEKTTFRLKTPGDFVNLEPDLILKYVMSAVRELSGSGKDGSITLEKLRKSGFIAD